jgi:hypothetical protein
VSESIPITEAWLADAAVLVKSELAADEISLPVNYWRAVAVPTSIAFKPLPPLPPLGLVPESPP